jgi:hypothetical protein
MDVADLFVASTIPNQPVFDAGSIIVSASREADSVFWLVFLL